MTRTRTLLATLLSLVAIPAFAHTGHDHDFNLLAGLSHPLAGMDHLLAMLAVGLWAAMQKQGSRLAAPVCFIAFMLLGAISANLGMALPAVESGIALSVLVLGLMVACGSRLPLAAGLPLISVFALLHGYAHGSEAPAGSFVSYIAGFVISTAVLHTAGNLAGLQLQQRSRLWLRSSGSLIAATGAWLLAYAL